MNQTFIVLVVKVSDITHLEIFRPISLCNIVYKILSKIVVNRMKPILKKAISPTQNKFVLGWFFLDLVITSHNVLYSMKRRENLGMTMKLDISKAYDNVRREFLVKIIRKFNFGEKFILLIRGMINNTKLFVLTNGTTSDFFSIGRGLHQGYPLSHYLFIMVAEILRRNILAMVACVGLIFCMVNFPLFR